MNYELLHQLKWNSINSGDFLKFVITAKDCCSGCPTQEPKSIVKPLAIKSVDLNIRKVKFKKTLFLTWLIETLRATFCQFDSVIVFMASGDSSTRTSVVTPTLLSAHVRLTVTPCNTLPHRHTTTKLFFRKPTPLGNRHSPAFSLPHIDISTPLRAEVSNIRICRLFVSFRQVYFHVEG